MDGAKKPPFPAPESDPGSRADDFWRYSLSVYDRPGVAPACLTLQDDHGADVNMLLLCCWWARNRSRPLDIDQCRALLAAVETWRRGAVEPLREVRRYVRRHGDRHGDRQGDRRSARDREIAALAKAVGDCELMSERIEQRLLVAALPADGEATADGGNGPGDARKNITAYFGAAGLTLSGDGRTVVEALLDAVRGNAR